MFQTDWFVDDYRLPNLKNPGYEFNNLFPLEFTDMVLGFIREFPDKFKIHDRNSGLFFFEKPNEELKSVQIAIESPLDYETIDNYFTPIELNEGSEAYTTGEGIVSIGDQIYRNPQNISNKLTVLIESQFDYNDGSQVKVSLVRTTEWNSMELTTSYDGNELNRQMMISPFVNSYGEECGGYIDVTGIDPSTHYLYKSFTTLNEEEQLNALSMIDYVKETIRMITLVLRNKHTQTSKVGQF